MLRVALTHDVDRTYKSYQYVTYFVKALLNRDTNCALYHFSSLFKNNPYWNFEEIIRIENEFNVKSTFFFLNESIEFNPLSLSNWKLSLGRYDIKSEKIINAIRFLDSNGWEIGVHGSYNSYKNPELLLKEKKILENILGHEVFGVRQHYLNLDEKRTWKYQKELGFKYDASFGYTDSIGFMGKKVIPFKPFSDGFVVFPLPIMDSCFMNTVSKWEKFQELIDIVLKNNALLVINWHQRSFNRDEFPGYTETYTDIIEKSIDMKAKFFTLGEYLKVFPK